MAGVLKPSPGALRIIDDLEEGLAIVVNGNTAPKNIAAGQYLFIKNHSTLATGGYHATAAISSGGTISSSNVAADADGIANSLNSKLSIVTKTHTFSNVGAGAGTWETVQLSVPSGKTLLMASVYQTSGLNLAPVWIKAVGSSSVDVMVWNGRTGATDVGVTVVGLCW